MTKRMVGSTPIIRSTIGVSMEAPICYFLLYQVILHFRLSVFTAAQKPVYEGTETAHTADKQQAES